MNIKKELMVMLFSAQLNFEKDSIYAEEYMPHGFDDKLEKVLTIEHKGMWLNSDLNEWEISPKLKFGIIAVSAGYKTSTLQSTALFHIDLKNGEVTLKGVQQS